MNITLKRYRKKHDWIDGRLYIDGQKVCDTAENALYCLRQGTYPVEICKCKQYARKMPVISIGVSCRNCQKMEFCCTNSNLPCYCPQLKPGNGVHNRTDGSIILGTYIVPGCLKLPREAFDSVYDRLCKSAERGHQITLTIINEYLV